MLFRLTFGFAPLALALTVGASSVCHAATPGESAPDAPDSLAPATPEREARNEVPVLAYTYAAAGVDGLTFGAQGYGAMVARSALPVAAGGGVTVYGSPIDRLTLVADLPRDATTRQFSPSATVLARPYGEVGRDFAFGVMAKYKVEGFSMGPDGELEHELEAGLLTGYVADGWHLDVNAIAGVGLTEEAEVDVEGRARFGYDLGDYVRLGVDGQVRGRVHGDQRLPGGRTWDFAAGPQVTASVSHFFSSFTAGPSTLGVERGVGFSAVLTAGGTTL